MKLELTTVVAEGREGAFCNHPTKWHYKITTGSRCNGLISAHKYKCPIQAAIAGERMIKKLNGDTR